MPAVVSYTVTKPSGATLTFSGRANSVGYYFRARDDFAVDQPGIYQVDLRVDYDGVTAAGQVTAPFPTGDVLGSASGRFHVYVVRRGSAPLDVPLASNAFLPAPATLTVPANVPAGMTATRVHRTTTMPGFVLEAGDLPTSSSVTYRYDPVALARDFPNLDVTRFGRPVAADAITISLAAVGTSGTGQPAAAARVMTLHGTEQLNLALPSTAPPKLDVTVDQPAYRLSGPAATLTVHYAPGFGGGDVDAYVGLRRPDGALESVTSRGGTFVLSSPAPAPAPTAQTALPTFNYAGPLAVRAWIPADPPGVWLAYAVLVRAGQSPLDPSNWVGSSTAVFTVSP